MITFRPLYQDYVNTKPDIGFWITQTPVPAVGDTAKWTLSNFTITAGGVLDASAVAATSYAERYIPGVLQGHLYKVVIVAGTADDDIIVTMGGVSLGTIGAPGTYTYWVLPTDGLPLKFDYPAGLGLTATITSVVIEAYDPINPDLIPEA